MSIEDHIKARFKNDHHKAMVNIRFTSNWLMNSQNAQLAEFGLSLPQFNILRILRGANEELSVKTVKNRMLEQSPNTTRLIDKLISKNLVHRRRSKSDRRVIYLSLTNNGYSLLKEIDEDFDEINLEGSLSIEEAQLLNCLLDKVRSDI